MNKEDTICAISTAPGSGAIAIVRLSGNQAIEIAGKIISFKSGDKNLSSQQANSARSALIKEGNNVIDNVVVTLFKSPGSYTGEDIVEIACHGSIYIQQKILNLLIKNGARLADPGEFTFRAFMNQKMDLAQAEAVADLIAADSQASHQVAMKQMRGGFSNQLYYLREKLLDFISLVELELDFSEEDIEFADREELNKLLLEIDSLTKKLINSFELGNAIKNGIPVAIIGKTNAGKSTLLNALLNDEKAIVSEIAGTTRDSIEDVITVKGINFRFIDTAGLRETMDKIETIGIQRTYDIIGKAKIILQVIDSLDDEKEIKQQVKNITPLENQKRILVFNKIDQIPLEEVKKKITKLFPLEEEEMIFLSAKNKENIDRLLEILTNEVALDKYGESDVIITNARHYEALVNAGIFLQKVKDDMLSNLPGDLLAMDIREVIRFLGKITGEISDDDILGNIFANFCIGK